MTPEPRLNFLAALREAVGLKQAEVAQRFGLAGRQSYKSVAAWEKGESAPKAKLRARFIRYLWDDLRLHKEPNRFVEAWTILVECWHWEPLSDAERAALRLLSPYPKPERATGAPPTPSTTIDGPVVGGNVATTGGHFVGGNQFILQFSQLYQQPTDTLDTTQLAVQITEYLEWLEDSTRTIELRGISARDTRVSLPLTEVFVPLRAELSDQRHQAEEREIALDQVLAAGERLVVIGGPGSGKSTVLQYIAWVLATALLNNDGAQAETKLGLRLSAAEPLPPLPLYLPLSAYAHLRFRSGQAGDALTFPDFIQRYLKQSHCHVAGLPPDFFARLLQSGRSVILLLDGLDEVADEKQREIVTQTIERLVGPRKQIRAVVTCRSVAYKGQAILARGFRQVTVQPLDEDHVARLVQQAYSAVYHANPAEQAARIAELLTGIKRLEGEHARRQHDRAERLINSPLLVRMLLIVHLNDRKLPQHRADLYRRFVEAILHADYVTDREVAQQLSSLRGNNLALMSHLAFAMHSQGEEQGREVERETVEALLDPAYAAETPTFLQLIHLRGTLVEERNGFYRFLHLAFQEYLAARYLAQEYWRNEGMKPTFHFLAQQAPHSWWREVATLLPGYLREESPLNAKRVISALAALDEWQALATAWSPDVQLAAAEIAATATLEWFPNDAPLRHVIVQRLMHFFSNNDILNQIQPRVRVLAGRALGALGDPRFLSKVYFLPDDPLLGFIEITKGEFSMGEGKEIHKITLPTFYIARYPVTVAQFRAFVEATGDRPSTTDSLRDSDNSPVRYVTWHKAVQYCQWLDRTLRSSNQTPKLLADKLQNGWQILLPSETEWEKAARGTTGRIYPWGNSEANPSITNYKATGIGTSSPVGCFPSGATIDGVEEMAGNVWEWTRSLYRRYPHGCDEKEHQSREILSAKSTDQVVMRGGSFFRGVDAMRTTSRRSRDPDDKNSHNGFRLVCVRRCS